ncbi:MAG: hypothetical protein V4617_12895 [Gemmatimonadota bacterium]
MTGIVHGLLQALSAAAQDTAAGSAGVGGAYVARPGGPPDTAAYMWAGYAIALIVYGGYIVLLQRRIARTRDTSRRDALRDATRDGRSTGS